MKKKQVGEKTEPDKFCLSFIVGDLLLIIRLEADYNKWTSNGHVIQQRFCLALCKSMQLPTDSLGIERVEEGSVILHILIHPPHGQFFIKQILGRGRDNVSSISIIQAVKNCCAKFDSRLHSIVIGKYTLNIEKRLMDLKSDKTYVNNICGSTRDTSSIDPFDREDKQSLCPEGSVNFLFASEIYIIIK